MIFCHVEIMLEKDLVMERLTITLTPDLAARVKSAVESGNYGSVSEVMRQALRDWELAEARRQAELQTLRSNVQVGLDQIAAGKSKPFNAARIVKAGNQLATKKR
ncbi:MAG: type II toxin-antitoxin system ParD family antitoxin [Hyphomicrobium sp.]